MNRIILIVTLVIWLPIINVFSNNAPQVEARQTTSSTTLPAKLINYYAEVSRTVVEGDYEGMVALYHKEGVLVTSKKSMPIAQALAGWKPGIEDTKAGKLKCNVAFRFSNLKSGEGTAHVTGIFHYTSEKSTGESEADEFIHFEMLLIQHNGAWVALMEYQKSRATKEEWRALK